MNQKETELLAETALLTALEAQEEAKRRRGKGGMMGIGTHTHVLAETDVPILTDAKYPSALLLDGSRAMTGDLTRRYSYSDFNYDAVLGVLDETEGYGGAPSPFIKLATGDAPIWRIIQEGTNDFLIFEYFNGASWSTKFFWDAATGSFNAGGHVRPSLSAVSDLGTAAKLFQDGWFSRYLRIGSVSLPAASATHRGKMVRVAGAAGVADLLYCCMKSAADTYSWVQIAIG